MFIKQTKWSNISAAAWHLTKCCWFCLQRGKMVGPLITALCYIDKWDYGSANFMFAKFIKEHLEQTGTIYCTHCTNCLLVNNIFLLFFCILKCIYVYLFGMYLFTFFWLAHKFSGRFSDMHVSSTTFPIVLNVLKSSGWIRRSDLQKIKGCIMVNQNLTENQTLYGTH